MAHGGDKLKDFRQSKKWNQTQMAEFLSIGFRSYQDLEKSGVVKKADVLSRINKLTGIDMQNVSQGTFAQEQEKPYLQKRKELKNGDKAAKAIPFYDAPAAAGLTETEMTAIHAPAGTIDVGDLLSDSQAAIRIYGNSMLPNYPPGCVVGLARCNKSFIEPGEVYVIETSDRRILKRLFYKGDISDGDWLTCYSDNIMKFEGGARDGRLAYPPFDIPKKEIINLFVVTGVIKRNANSVIINR